MAQPGYDHAADQCRLTKADFSLGRMDVYVDLRWRQINEQRHHGMPVPREHFGISAAHSANQQPVLYRTAIDEQKLVVGNAAIIGGQARHPAKAHTFTFEIKRHAVVDKFPAGQRGHALGPCAGGLHGQHTPAVMFNGKANVRPRHRQPLHGIQRGRIFGAGAAQEFAAGGHIAKQIFNANARALRQCGWPLTCHHAMVDRPRPAFGASGPAFQRHFGHAGDGRQSLPPETQG